MKKKIRIFDLKFDKKYKKKFLLGASKILDEGFLSNHTYVRKLEKKLNRVCRSKFSLAVNSGTAAIELILRSINIKNKKVLVGNNTFIATATAIKNAGGIVEPVDIDDLHYSLSYEELKKKINTKIGAVVVIHIGGLITPDIFKIAKLCKKFNVPLVEDCAQAFGSKYKKKYAGSFGIAGAFSLQTTKVLTAGEGGWVVSNNKTLYNQMSRDRIYGISKKNKLIYETDGSNLKMSEFVALAALCDLDRVNLRIKKRELLAKRYQSNLKNSSFKTLKPVKGSKTGYYKQIILSPFKREIVEKEFAKFNVSMTGGVYYKPLSAQKVLQIKKHKNFLNSYFFCNYHFCPPCYPELNLSDIDFICKILIRIDYLNKPN